MSIFKDTFKDEIKEQLKARETVIDTLLYPSNSPLSTTWFHSRNAWVRMTSAVDVGIGDDGGTARDYVLQSWLGPNPFNESYITTFGVNINKNSNPIPHRLGLRPIPGITSVEVKSRGAYGSLRDVTVNFQCWDITQLETLEALYMRPGYTVLVEWGWAPVLDNTGKIDTYPIEFIDDVLDARDGSPSKSQILSTIFDKAISKNGNYDAHYGYIKQYGWSSRDDGGYDCSITVISVGEIVESLKINYSPLNYSSIVYGGILQKATGAKANIVDRKLRDNYNRNILAGLFYELWEIGRLLPEGSSTQLIDNQYKRVGIGPSQLQYNLFYQKIDINGGTAEATSAGEVGESDEQVYITLETLFNLLNNYVLLKDGNDGKPIRCSVLDREYLAPNQTVTFNRTTGEGFLLCLAHPLQISVDPTVCAIKSNIWIGGFTVDPSTIAGANVGTNVTKWSSTSYVQLFNDIGPMIWDDVKKNEVSNINEQLVIDAIIKATGQQTKEFRELQRQYLLLLNAASTGAPVPAELAKTGTFIYQYVQKFKSPSFYALLDRFLGLPELNGIIGPRYTGATPTDFQMVVDNNRDALSLDPAVSAQNQLNRAKESLKNSQDSGNSENIQYLNNLLPYFYKDNPYTETGIIGNIYLNVNFLYKLVSGGELESKDTKEKLDINLYDFLKSIASEMSNATGNLNNFEIHIDPIDDTLRIIDVNYVDTEKDRDAIYKNLHTLQIHNNKSTARTYKLESQIFPDQSSIVAIGAQAGGGAMSTDNNTWLDFNRGLTDRVITKKIDPLADATLDPVTSAVTQLDSIKLALASLGRFFSRQNTGWWKVLDKDFDADDSIKYKNALKDIIIFFKNITKSDTKNRSIIPTKLSVTLDGIGGLVIGHLFKIPDDLLPAGYKVGGDIGSQLGYVITGIGHSISEGDWSTTIDAQTIILSNPSGSQINFKDLVITGSNGQTTTRPRGGGGGGTNVPNSIILHYTQGVSDPQSVINDLYSRGLSVHYCVGRDGTVATGDAENIIGAHAGGKNTNSVGIEIVTYGGMNLKNGKYYSIGYKKDSAGKLVPYDKEFKGSYNEIVDLGYTYNGFRYYLDYTDAQITALRTLMQGIIQRNPGIVLNYSKSNAASIYQNVFGIPGIPQKGQSYTSPRTATPADPGIFSHSMVKGGTHTDTFPSPKMIDLLKSL